jgi:Tfp pilus assembly protein PilN
MRSAQAQPAGHPMMRRVELLPPRFVQRRRERRSVALIALGGLLVVLLLILWWFMLQQSIRAEQENLTAVESHNAALDAQVAELQRFAELDGEVTEKRAALQTVMKGDLDWPALLTEVALVVPGEVWLTNMTASAGQAEGSAPVGTETAPIRVSDEESLGRIQFQGSSLSLPGVAKWLLRQEATDEFAAAWLNSASEAEASSGTTGGGVPVVTFDSTLELSRIAASDRFAGGSLTDEAPATEDGGGP